MSSLRSVSEALAFQRRRKQGAALSAVGEMCCSLVAKGTFGTALIFGPFHQGKGLGHAAAMSGKDNRLLFCRNNAIFLSLHPNEHNFQPIPTTVSLSLLIMIYHI